MDLLFLPQQGLRIKRYMDNTNQYMNNYWLLLLMISTLLVSCTRPEKTYHETGELYEVFYQDKEGKKHGKYMRYHLEGSVAEELEYNHGLPAGTRKLYYEDGKLESESKYERGQLNGFHRVYYPSGKLMIDAVYKDNAMNGTFKKFNEDGSLQEVVNFENGEENGPFEEYYQNGKLKWKGTYRNGDHEYGLLEHFDSTGVLIKKMECDSFFICRTIWKKEGYEE